MVFPSNRERKNPETFTCFIGEQGVSHVSLQTIPKMTGKSET